jgi:hypothetical protein
VLCHEVLPAIGAELAAPRVWENDFGGTAGWLMEPRLESNYRLLGQGRASLLPAFADAPHMGTGSEHHILAAKAGHLRKPQASLDCN